MPRAPLTTPPPVSPYLGMAGLAVGITVGSVLLVVRELLFGDEGMPLPALLALGPALAFTGLLMRANRHVVRVEIAGWAGRPQGRPSRPALWLSFAAHLVLYDQLSRAEPWSGLAGAAVMTAAGLLVARRRGTDPVLAATFYCAFWALLLGATAAALGPYGPY